MDNRIRRNECCVIGLPRCDFVFSSTRTCFIGYGFKESALEMAIVRDLLKTRGIEAVEAGGTLAPGQYAFCAKICSKIIVSQFCVVLANNDINNGAEMPNANVSVEYGLMLGFNKYVVPFQRDSQALPFNVAGLDTIKYSNDTFQQKTTQAIDTAIAATNQPSPPPLSTDQNIEAFLLARRRMFVSLAGEGDRVLFELGRPLGFNLVMTFDGMQYAYFGNFTVLRPETIMWRLGTLEQILEERFGSISERVKLGMVKNEALATLVKLRSEMRILLLVTRDEDRQIIKEALGGRKNICPVEVYSLNDVSSALREMG